MRITEGILRKIIRDVISESQNKEFVSENEDSIINLMHDKYDLGDHRLFDPDDIDLLVKIYMNDNYRFEKMTSMRGLPERLVKIFVEYNVRVYYDKNLQDLEKLDLIVGDEINPVDFVRSAEKELLLPDESHRDTFELSSSGEIIFTLYYFNQNVGLLKTTTAKVTIALRFDPDMQKRLVSFLKEKGFVEK